MWITAASKEQAAAGAGLSGLCYELGIGEKSCLESEHPRCLSEASPAVEPYRALWSCLFSSVPLPWDKSELPLCTLPHTGGLA